MIKRFPLKLLVAFGFLLNMLWEFAQCLFLYDMSGWSFWRTAVYMWATIAGDVFIVLGVVMGSWITGASTTVCGRSVGTPELAGSSLCR
jgi:hypothetical protein